MIEFAVKIADEATGRWVIAVDPAGERFLVANDDQTFRWVSMATCKLLKAQTPDVPRAVIAVQPQVAPKITLPAMKFNGGRG